MDRLANVARHVVSTTPAAATTSAEQPEAATVTQGDLVRERLAAKMPKAAAANAELAERDLLAMGAALQTRQHPVLAAKSKGAHTWDIDGNRYLDLHGFGSHILGFSHDVVVAATKAEIDEGLGIHNAWYLVRQGQDRVASLLAEASPHVCEQALFVSSGNDATAMAMRAARAHTQRTRIALCHGAYHGEHDHTQTTKGGLPAAQESIVRIPFNDDDAFETIRAHAHELAMVFVEAVPSSVPTTSHVPWLRRLEVICRECGVLFGMDETITGEPHDC